METEITDIKFNPNNRNILLQTSSGIVYLIDAFNGNLQHVLGSTTQFGAGEREKKKRKCAHLSGLGAFIPTSLIRTCFLFPVLFFIYY